jgi:hypothetical protein
MNERSAGQRTLSVHSALFAGGLLLWWETEASQKIGEPWVRAQAVEVWVIPQHVHTSSPACLHGFLQAGQCLLFLTQSDVALLSPTATTSIARARLSEGTSVPTVRPMAICEASMASSLRLISRALSTRWQLGLNTHGEIEFFAETVPRHQVLA